MSGALEPDQGLSCLIAPALRVGAGCQEKQQVKPLDIGDSRLSSCPGQGDTVAFKVGECLRKSCQPGEVMSGEAQSEAEPKVSLERSGRTLSCCPAQKPPLFLVWPLPVCSAPFLLSALPLPPPPPLSFFSIWGSSFHSPDHWLFLPFSPPSFPQTPCLGVGLCFLEYTSHVLPPVRLQTSTARGYMGADLRL